MQAEWESRVYNATSTQQEGESRVYIHGFTMEQFSDTGGIGVTGLQCNQHAARMGVPGLQRDTSHELGTSDSKLKKRPSPGLREALYFTEPRRRENMQILRAPATFPEMLL